jgi:peroxiredoxin Q/BCP
VVKRYGVWIKKKFMGMEFMRTYPTSFLLNPEGKIAKIYEMVKPDNNTQQLLENIILLKK